MRVCVCVCLAPHCLHRLLGSRTPQQPPAPPTATAAVQGRRTPSPPPPPPHCLAVAAWLCEPAAVLESGVEAVCCGLCGVKHSMEQPPQPLQPPPQPSQPPDPCSSNGAVVHRAVGRHGHSSGPAGSGGGAAVHNGTVPAPTPTAARARFTQLLEGLDAPGDSGNPAEPPPWLDRELFARGREFYRRYLFCVFISDLVALLALFGVARILRPLIYTRRSDTAFRALRRYVSTISRVVLWYSGDLWRPQDPAHLDILKVRRIHAAAAATFNDPAHHAGVHAATAAAPR